MFRQIDRSKRLGKLIDSTSSGLSKRRGLPMVIGIALIVVALVIQLLGYIISSPAIDIIGTILHSVGVLSALIGLTVSTPLGK